MPSIALCEGEYDLEWFIFLLFRLVFTSSLSNTVLYQLMTLSKCA